MSAATLDRLRAQLAAAEDDRDLDRAVATYFAELYPEELPCEQDLIFFGKRTPEMSDALRAEAETLCGCRTPGARFGELHDCPALLNPAWWSDLCFDSWEMMDEASDGMATDGAE